MHQARKATNQASSGSVKSGYGCSYRHAALGLQRAHDSSADRRSLLTGCDSVLPAGVPFPNFNRNRNVAIAFALHMSCVLDNFDEKSPTIGEGARDHVVKTLSEVFKNCLSIQREDDEETALAFVYVQSFASLKEQNRVAGHMFPLMAQELSERAKDFMDDGKYRDPTPLQRMQTARAPTNTDEMEGLFGMLDHRMKFNPNEDPRQSSIHIQVNCTICTDLQNVLCVAPNGVIAGATQ